MADPTAKLAPYAADPPPSLPQLREELAALESAAPPPPDPNAAPTFWDHVKRILQPLISVRPLHDPRFTDLETALASGDAQAALDASKFLPDEARPALALWQAKLEQRTALDNALRDFAARFAAPQAKGDTP